MNSRGNIALYFFCLTKLLPILNNHLISTQQTQKIHSWVQNIKKSKIIDNIENKYCQNRICNNTITSILLLS